MRREDSTRRGCRVQCQPNDPFVACLVPLGVRLLLEPDPRPMYRHLGGQDVGWNRRFGSRVDLLSDGVSWAVFGNRAAPAFDDAWVPCPTPILAQARLIGALRVPRRRVSGAGVHLTCRDDHRIRHVDRNTARGPNTRPRLLALCRSARPHTAAASVWHTHQGGFAAQERNGHRRAPRERAARSNRPASRSCCEDWVDATPARASRCPGRGPRPAGVARRS